MKCPEWWHATQNFLVPGLILSLICLAMEQHLLGSMLLACNIGFLGWVLYHRCGLLASLTVKRGVSFNLRHMKETLHFPLYQTRCLNNLIALIERHKKGPRIVEKGDGISTILRAFILYSDMEDDDGIGNYDITKLALEALFGLLRTSPKDAATQILQKWTIKHAATYIDELNNNLDLDENKRCELLVWVLKVVAQLSEHTAVKKRHGKGWSVVLIKSLLSCMRTRMRDEKSESVQQWGCCVLFNTQHGVNAAKETFGACHGFSIVLDAVRRHRKAVQINQLAAVLMAECVFESVKNGTTELKFLPEVFAEALSNGVMSALQDMAQQHSECADIANCNRLLKSEYAKPRRPEIEVDHVEFVELNE
jgi:hypothetical protein